MGRTGRDDPAGENRSEQACIRYSPFRGLLRHGLVTAKKVETLAEDLKALTAGHMTDLVASVSLARTASWWESEWQMNPRGKVCGGY